MGINGLPRIYRCSWQGKSYTFEKYCPIIIYMHEQEKN